MATITSPVKGYNGKVAGVNFNDGSGNTDDPSALAYFRRQGYTVTGGEAPKPEKGNPEKGTDKPGGNASKDEWTEYAKAQGKTDEELDGLARDDIKALFEESK